MSERTLEGGEIWEGGSKGGKEGRREGRREGGTERGSGVWGVRICLLVHTVYNS